MIMLIGIPTIPTPQEHPAGFSILEAISRASAFWTLELFFLVALCQVEHVVFRLLTGTVPEVYYIVFAYRVS